MARQRRTGYPGALYPIALRDNARLPIYEHEKDRGRFLDILNHVVSHYLSLCHTGCLMGNHDHLLIETTRCLRLSAPSTSEVLPDVLVNIT